MASVQPNCLIRYIHNLASPNGRAVLSDGELLKRFTAGGDESAFEILLSRHAAMVLGICGSIVRNPQDAEDAFQATFLTLVRKAHSINQTESLGAWLHQVAYRLALKVQAGKRGPHEQSGCQRALTAIPARSAGDQTLWELRSILHEEVARLPAKYRAPVVACYLEGKTYKQAARALGWSSGTVSGRLSRARDLLRARLSRRGIGLSVTLATGLLTEGSATGAPTALVKATLEAALSFGKGGARLAIYVSPVAAAYTTGILRTMMMIKLRIAAAIVLAIAVVGTGAGILGQQLLAQKPAPEGKPALVPGNANALSLPAEMLGAWGVQTNPVHVRAAKQPRILQLVGSLALDPNRLLRVSSRLSGEVVELGRQSGEGNLPLAPGAKVKKDQLLAVIWSKDLAAKKADLLDALTRLQLDQELWDKLKKKAGTVPEVLILNAERDVKSDQNAVDRADATLQAWGLAEQEIKELQAEADRLARRKGKWDPDKEKEWGRLEIRAPWEGVIVEKNVSPGEVIVDRTQPLFQIADLGRLLVQANAAESDLPALQALKLEHRHWTIRVPADPKIEPIDGKIDQIGYLIEPGTHTAIVTGSVDNRAGRLRAGQYVTVAITLPAASDEIAVPTSALIEEGGEHLVFVQPDPKILVYELRRVAVVRRGQDIVHVRSGVNWESDKKALKSLQPGECVVTRGAIELKTALADLQKQP
jgi:cobalt-zinc-cadmium efflux system membrane fusion protein